VDHLDHWTNTHTPLPITCSKIQWQNDTNDNNLATTARKMRCQRHMVHTDKPTGHPKRPRAFLTSKRHMTPPALHKTTLPRTPTQKIQYFNRAHNRQQEQHRQATRHTRTNNMATNQPQQ
jgi:hypothetical protein